MSDLRPPRPDRNPVRVLLAHEDRIERYGLGRALGDGGLEIVGEAQTSEQVLPLVARTRPDVLLVSTALAGDGGFALLDAVRDRYARTQTLVLGRSAASEEAAEALAAGAGGFVSTDVEPAHLAAVLMEAAAGTICLPPAAGRVPAPAETLTERELSVLRGAARGLSNDAIGRELWLSPHTVKSHLHRIYTKLDVANRTEAARWALEHRLVGSES